MALAGDRTYVGFGFGAIQAGLFLYEALRSGAFARLVVAEVLPDRVAALRRADGYCVVNIAHTDRIETARVGPIDILDPADDEDREQLVAAIAVAHELGTAIPSVNYYVSEGPGSLHRVLAAGLARKMAVDGPQAVLYAAENDNHAAEKLRAAIIERSAHPNQLDERITLLNTVIGKMSGYVASGDGLLSVTPGDGQAFLVEAFNRILISRVELPCLAGAPPFRRGITVFEEKDDLLPFEEAKLYGHNAVHALAAYIGRRLGLVHIYEARAVPGMMDFLRAAFIDETGRALTRKYGDVDPLFTPANFADYADDLLARMTNPLLRDSVDRVGRDPMRKLGWDDRLIGTMRLALGQGVTPRRFALGAAAALDALAAAEDAVEGEFAVSPDALAAVCTRLWRDAQPEPAEKEQVVDLLIEAWQHLHTTDTALFF